MNELVNELCADIIAPIHVQKIANEILSPCLEKEAASGVAAFGEALSGAKAKRLRGEVEDIAGRIEKAKYNPRLNETKGEVDRIKKDLSNSSVHERMDSSRQNLDNAKNHYDQTVRFNDDVLNHYTGTRALLKPFSPSYIGAKMENASAKLGLRNAKSQYKSQQKRVEKDLTEDLNHAKRKFNDAEKESGINGLHEELDNKRKELSKAEEQTSHARTVAGVGTAGAVGLGIYHNKKNNPSPGPYTYGYDYRQAKENGNLVEKIAEEILQGMYEK